MSEPDYIIESRDEIDKQIEELLRRASEARGEARHAREHPGLEGPARNAEADSADLERRIAELREVALRVNRGYEWWDREGFESALEAYGEPWRWQTLSESVGRDFVYGNDEVDVRLSIDVQRAYGCAFESGLFNRFELCEWYETDGEFVTKTRGFLFGVTDFDRLGACTFLVAGWDS